MQGLDQGVEMEQWTPRLFLYDHCPFCTRVRICLGLKRIPHVTIFLPFADEQTVLNMRKDGVRNLPVFEPQPGMFIAESAPIIEFIGKNLSAPLLGPPSSAFCPPFCPLLLCCNTAAPPLLGHDLLYPCRPPFLGDGSRPPSSSSRGARRSFRRQHVRFSLLLPRPARPTDRRVERLVVLLQLWKATESSLRHR